MDSHDDGRETPAVTARARLQRLTGLRRLPIVRQVRVQELPHATFVRNAVVVGCDGKPSSDAALRFAAAEAQLRRAELVVVIAFGRPVDPDVPSFYAPEGELRWRARRAAEQSLARVLRVPACELAGFHVVTEHGPASWVLLRDYREAQLLVVGSRPRRLMSGRTVRYLIRHSPVPVVVVPAGDKAGGR